MLLGCSTPHNAVNQYPSVKKNVKYYVQDRVAVAHPSDTPNVSSGNRSVGHATLRKRDHAALEKDGAPVGPMPVAFKEVKPRNEPLSRYGNPGEYRIDGRTYEVMPSAKGYRSRGVASWYGTKFHKKLTSSGEKYDMYALTAAHRTLPLPTYVRVRNVSNGKQAIVKVNDRGPFHSDRVIDLSYAAAIKLGLLPKGTAQVEVEALTLKGAHHVAHYYLQAGAFNSAKLANALKNKLHNMTHSPVQIEHDKQQYLVWVGPFASKTMTDNLRIALARNGVHGSFSLLQ